MPPLGKKGSVFPARSQGVFGCENCREQHLKCDRVTPICGRCQNAGRECRRTGLRVRETKTKYAKTQKWVKTPRRIVFIHETTFNEGEALSPDSGPEDYLEVDPSGSPETMPDGPSRRSSLQSPIKSCSRTPVSPRFPRDIFAPHKPLSPFDEPLKSPNPFTTHEQQTTKQKGSSEDNGRSYMKEKSGSPSDRFLRQPIYLDDATDNNLEKARLIRHYVQKLAIWLDLCDPKQSFQTIVPQRAGQCTILLNSILALAARHRAHVDKAFPADAYQHYASECIKELLGWIDRGLWQEDVFAATVIMRVMAELEAKDNGGQLKDNFLTSLQLCVQHQKTMLRYDNLGSAAFWVGLRQEIYNAVTHQKKVSMLRTVEDVLPDKFKNSLSATDDYTWANRAVVHCAEVLNFCFGENSEKTSERWDQLMIWNEQWSLGTAQTYKPIYRERDRVPFPEIWYTQSCHVIGTQHHLLAKLFLTQSRPGIPTVGVPAEQARESIRPTLQSIMREICGIGLGNSWTPPSMFTACMAIHTFGCWFSDRIDQEHMIKILRQTEHDHGRSTAQVQMAMINTVWHWDVIPDHLVKQECLKDESPMRTNSQLMR